MKFIFTYLLVLVSLLAKGQAPFYDYEFIDVNNFRVAHAVHGDFWHSWDANHTIQHGCEYPKGSGKNLGLAASLWMGGIDLQNNLRVSATTYRSNGVEYWPGPLSNPNISYTESGNWARVWKINRSDIQAFLAQPVHTVINTPAVILEWPARGNSFAKGKNGASLMLPDRDFAPFIDAGGSTNDPTRYDPLEGDYPDMKGDQMLWFIYNDAGSTPHNEITLAPPCNVEIQAMVYGYKRNTNADNMLFYEFKLINISGLRLDSFTVGPFVDFDLGHALNDYMGFDSSRTLGYVYNGTSTDGSYNDSIPMAGVRMLKFPGKDCLHDSTLGSFMVYENSASVSIGNPHNGSDVYYYLNHTWKDGSPLREPSNVGSTFYNKGYGGTGDAASYMYDSSSSVTGVNWSECDQANLPGDRKMVMGIKPMVFMPGESIQLAFALVATPRKLNNGCPSYDMAALTAVADTAQVIFCNPLPPLTTDIKTIGGNVKALRIYPNPSEASVYIEADFGKADHVEVYDVWGKEIMVPIQKKDKQWVLDISGIVAGAYFIRGSVHNEAVAGKFFKN